MEQLFVPRLWPHMSSPLWRYHECIASLAHLSCLVLTTLCRSLSRLSTGASPSYSSIPQLPVQSHAHALSRAYRIFPLSLPSAAQLASVTHRHWDVVKWMVSEAGVNVLTQDHRTGFGLLHAACKGGQAALLDQLLTWDLQIPTDRGLSPLYSSWHRSPDDASFAPCAFLLAQRTASLLRL